MEARDILIKPIVTEKSTALMEERKYTLRDPSGCRTDLQSKSSGCEYHAL